MANKTRKHIWSVPLVASIAIIGVLAAFLVLANNPGVSMAQGGEDPCAGMTDEERSDHLLAGGTCGVPAAEPTDPLDDVPAPGNFRLDALDNGARLSWGALADSDTHTVMGYQIDRKVYHADPAILALLRNNGGDATIDIGVKQQHRDLGLSYGTTYTYRVRAYVEATNADGTKKMGHGAWSRERTTVTADSGGRLEPLLTPPTAVRMLKGEKACNMITVTWQEPDDFGTVPAVDDNGEYVGPDYTGGEGAGKEEVGQKATEVTYKVERMVGSASWTMVAPDGMKYEDSGLTYDQTYKYRVRAMNSHGLYGPWAMIEVPLTRPTGVDRPENLRGTVNDRGQVLLQWTPPTGGNQTWFNGDKADADIGNGDASTRLTYQIERVDADNMDTGFGKVEQAHMYGPRSFDAQHPTHEQDYLDTEPHDGTVTYVVTAFVDGCLTSAGTSVTVDTEIGKPGAPGNVDADASGNAITVTWTAPANPGSRGDRSATIVSYNVERSAMSGSGFTSVASGHTATSYTDSGLDYNTKYYYRVSAVNSFGVTSDPSAEASDTTDAAPSLGAPAITASSTAAGQATIALTPGANATKHFVWAFRVGGTSNDTDGKWSGQVAGDATSVTIDGLTSGESYWFIPIAGRGEGAQTQWRWGVWSAATPIR